MGASPFNKKIKNKK
ncbi:unnamed protein product, partial [Vitis vinifera]